ncbi:hypothetical protein JRQ81_010459 [Phrynocephalus forsythii]|uniref:Uncharacterized protein n=1 Tax=Phrynocephalus forsythii TaxID=171643 RepID=A0A9Q0X8Y7_9SAUR|nr:hypothetical protein JRQ81_010459 [Phrynocephalus forsythii]
MGKDQELMQAVKAEDVGAVQKLLQRPKPGKARAQNPSSHGFVSDGAAQQALRPLVSEVTADSQREGRASKARVCTRREALHHLWPVHKSLYWAGCFLCGLIIRCAGPVLSAESLHPEDAKSQEMRRSSARL